MPIAVLPTTTFFNGGLDYALTRDQVLRVNFNGSQFVNENIGVGAYDLIERALYSRTAVRPLPPAERADRPPVRAQHAALGHGNDSEARSAVEAPTIIVNDAFTSGGAQRRGGTHTRNYWLNSDLDYVRGIHSMRAGIEVQHGRFDTDSTATTSAPTSSRASTPSRRGTPRSYTRRIGDPNIELHERAGRRLHPGRHQGPEELTVTGGVRYEAQTHVPTTAELRAARRRHLGAVQERQDDAARQLGHLLRLAVDRHLRADAAGRRLPPARAEHHQSVVPDPGDWSARRRRPTATCSPTDRDMAYRSGSAPASRRRSRAGSAPTCSTATAIATRC